MSHWAAPLIGKPWKAGADGPDAFDCWGLVRHVFRERHGVELPIVVAPRLDAAGIDNVVAIRTAARSSGWRPALAAEPQPDDVVLMWSIVDLHVGIVVSVLNGLRVLHSTQTGGVELPTWKEAIAGMKVELWRRAP